MSAFVVSDWTMHRAVKAMDSHPHGYTCEELDELGRRLFALNERAVAERYAGSVNVSHVVNDHAEYRYRPIKIHPRPVQNIQILMSLNCLHYQCSEGSVVDDPLYKRIEEQINRLQSAIIGDLDAYRACGWDGPPEKD